MQRHPIGSVVNPIKNNAEKTTTRIAILSSFFTKAPLFIAELYIIENIRQSVLKQ